MASFLFNTVQAAAALSRRAAAQVVDAPRQIVSAFGGSSSGNTIEPPLSPLSPPPLPPIDTQLDSRDPSEVLAGLQRCTSLLAQATSDSDLATLSQLFPRVVRHINTPDLTTRRLVLAYLADFASREPDVALLCVNTLQRDLSDPNPALRVMALRGMAAMRLHSIREIVMICVRQCLADRSPFVRRAAADALLSVASMDFGQNGDDGDNDNYDDRAMQRGQSDELVRCVEVMLANETSAIAMGAIARAWCVICPTNVTAIHSVYHRIIGMLNNDAAGAAADEWSILPMLRLLTLYSRQQYADPTAAKSIENVDPDHVALIEAVKSLLTRSMNPAVTCAAASSLLAIASPSEVVVKAWSAMLRCINGDVSAEAEFTELSTLDSMVSNLASNAADSLSSAFSTTAIAGDFVRRILFPRNAGDYQRSALTGANMIVRIRIIGRFVNFVSTEMLELIIREMDAVVHGEYAQPGVVCEALWLTAACSLADKSVPAFTRHSWRLLAGMLSGNDARSVPRVVETAASVAVWLVDNTDNLKAEYSTFVAKSAIKLMLSHPAASVVLLRGITEQEQLHDDIALMAELMRRATGLFAESDVFVKSAILDLSLVLINTHDTPDDTDDEKSLKDFIIQIHQYLLDIALVDLDASIRARAKFIQSTSATSVAPLFSALAETAPYSMQWPPIAASSHDNLDPYTLSQLVSVDLRFDGSEGLWPNWPIEPLPRINRTGLIPTLLAPAAAQSTAVAPTVIREKKEKLSQTDDIDDLDSFYSN